MSCGCSWVGIVAENGCLIHTRETKKTLATWIDMLANLNFTWKGPCIEVLNHLSTFTHSTDPVCVGLTFVQFTERKPGSFVAELGLASGPGRRAIVQIVSRCVVKLRKLRATFLTVSEGGRIIPRIVLHKPEDLVG